MLLPDHWISNATSSERSTEPQNRNTLTEFLYQDREAEPRFTGPPTGRGGYEGPPGRGGFGGGFGGAPPAGGGRQIFVNNVCILNHPSNSMSTAFVIDALNSSFPTLLAGKI